MMLAPAAAALLYPFLLAIFAALVSPPVAEGSWTALAGAAVALCCALAVPFVAMAAACRPNIPVGMRRLALYAVVAPTLYVFLGVVQTLIQSPFPDTVVWCMIWLAAGLWALRSGEKPEPVVRLGKPALRIAHGVAGAAVAPYVIFHVGNHLMGLFGSHMHARIMDAGRSVYRSPAIEPILVALMIFQAFSGLRLAWQWGSSARNGYRTFQVMSGVYLAVFIIGHMNSVFVYARTYLGIPTDWNFAIGAPTGLLHDPWNIRLLPHYGLGVFFVLTHMLSGLRVVALAHGYDRRMIDRLWWLSVGTSATIAVVIIAGMCGVRIQTAAETPSSPSLSGRYVLETTSQNSPALGRQLLEQVMKTRAAVAFEAGRRLRS